MFDGLKKVVFLQPQIARFSVAKRGALAQLARALAWHARGHRFDSVMLHKQKKTRMRLFLFIPLSVQVKPVAKSRPSGHKSDKTLRRRKDCGRCRPSAECQTGGAPPAFALPFL